MFAKNILQLVSECTVQFESFLVTAKIRKMSTLIAKMHRNTVSSSWDWRKWPQCSGEENKIMVFIWGLVFDFVFFLFCVLFFSFPAEHWSVKKGAAFKDNSSDVWRSQYTLYTLEDYGHRATGFHWSRQPSFICGQSVCESKLWSCFFLDSSEHLSLSSNWIFVSVLQRNNKVGSLYDSRCVMSHIPLCCCDDFLGFFWNSRPCIFFAFDLACTAHIEVLFHLFTILSMRARI